VPKQKKHSSLSFFVSCAKGRFFYIQNFVRVPSLRRRWLGDETPSSNHSWIAHSVTLLARDSGLNESDVNSR
jgi:hypothetical protein